MSRNSKSATNLARAKMYSKLRQEGKKSPSKTEPKHGKRHTYRTNPEIAKRLAEIAAGGSVKKTRGASIENVGAAAA